MTKKEHINAIQRAFEKAREDGYKIAVASDTEGNNWNTIEPLEYAMIYSDSNDTSIVLGVYESIDEQELF